MGVLDVGGRQDVRISFELHPTQPALAGGVFSIQLSRVKCSQGMFQCAVQFQITLRGIWIQRMSIGSNLRFTICRHSPNNALPWRLPLLVVVTEM